MKSLKYLMITLIVLSTVASYAQTKNQKTEIVKIYGNCGMCEKTIEKAGNMKNQSSVDWNKNTKMATISYDSLKTSKEEILKRIALAGYDSDTFLAPNDTYSSLPGCCQYDRAKGQNAKLAEPNIDIPAHDHSSKLTKTQDHNPLSVIYDGYFEVKDALVKTDATLASKKSSELLTAIKSVEMDKLPMDVHMAWMKVFKELQADAKLIADSKDISRQRDQFMSLSKNVYGLMKATQYEQPIYYQFCPMADNGKGANWLSKDATIKNPYYGSKMMNCGKTVETIK